MSKRHKKAQQADAALTLAYAGGEADAVRNGASRALATDTGQGNTHDV